MDVIVTGGAGFIGSNLVDELINNGHNVKALDNLSNGNPSFLNPKAKLIKKDLVTDNFENDIKNAETVFHFAANPDVKNSAKDTKSTFDNNVVATYRLLEACRKADVKQIVFASTSTVYGDAVLLPTPESYPCTPISNYGASKLAAEAYCAGYSASYGMQTTLMRFANIFGRRSTHGVIYDFYHKLKKNSKMLEILGNGKQEKSYLYVTDVVDATITAWKKQKGNLEVFNVGSSEKTTVDEIAKKICSHQNIKPKFEYTGGERGWVGDVPIMLLDTKKIRSLGWKEKMSFEVGLRNYLKWLENQAQC